MSEWIKDGFCWRDKNSGDADLFEDGFRTGVEWALSKPAKGVSDE